MRRLALLIIGAALLFSIACSGVSNVNSATTTPPSTPGPPPPLLVSDSDSSLQAALGSYCWYAKGASTCANATTLLTSREPLVASGEHQLTASLPGLKITEVRVYASPAAGADSQLQADGRIAWTETALGVELPATIANGGLTIDITPLNAGQYVVGVSLRVENRGEATYGFLLNKDSLP